MTRAGRQSKAQQAAAGESAAQDSAQPEIDVHELRNELARKLATMSGMPQHCAIARCRRLRRCVGRDANCPDTRPPKPVNREEEAASLAELQAYLKRAMKEGRARHQHRAAKQNAKKEHAREARARQRNARAALPRGRV